MLAIKVITYITYFVNCIPAKPILALSTVNTVRDETIKRKVADECRVLGLNGK